MEEALEEFVERDIDDSKDLAEAFADANEAAVNEWVENDNVPAREVKGQIIIDKEELVKNITIMNSALLREK